MKINVHRSTLCGDLIRAKLSEGRQVTLSAPFSWQFDVREVIHEWLDLDMSGHVIRT